MLFFNEAANILFFGEIFVFSAENNTMKLSNYPLIKILLPFVLGILSGYFGQFPYKMNNYYKPGPVTPKDQPVGHRILCPEGRSANMFPWRQFGRVYAAGNIVEGNPEVTHDNWAGGIQLIDKDGHQGSIEELNMMRSYEPFEMAPIRIMASDQVFDWVLPSRHHRP